LCGKEGEVAGDPHGYLSLFAYSQNSSACEEA
jgi:hypothetical protein